jgi:hypothetical protein
MLFPNQRIARRLKQSVEIVHLERTQLDQAAFQSRL